MVICSPPRSSVHRRLVDRPADPLRIRCWLDQRSLRYCARFGLGVELEGEPDAGAERVALGAPAVGQRLDQLEAAAVHAQRVRVVVGGGVEGLAAAVAHRDREGGVEGGPELGAAAGVDDRVGDQLGEAELGGGGDVVGHLGALEELAQEPPGVPGRTRVVLEHDPGGEGALVGRLGVVLVQVVAADADPAYGVRGAASGRLEQPALGLVEGPLLLEEDDEAADRGADPRQRDRGQGPDLGGLARHERRRTAGPASRGRPSPARRCGPRR